MYYEAIFAASVWAVNNNDSYNLWDAYGVLAIVLHM